MCVTFSVLATLLIVMNGGERVMGMCAVYCSKCIRNYLYEEFNSRGGGGGGAI